MQAKRETVVITKHGKPVAKLIPADNDSDNIYNFLAGKGGLPAMSFPLQLGVTSGGNSSDSGRHARCRLAGA
jgi:antitoxin (DNA-binding transcriptional repressor) of toxin-antitoxin stability system